MPPIVFTHARPFLTLVLLALPFVPSPARPAAGNETPSASPGQPGGEKGMSLERWRALNKAAEEIMDEPGEMEKISKLESFLKEHPDYPDPFPLLWTLVDSYVEADAYDPAHVAELIERMVRLDRQGRVSAERMVSKYYFRYGLPPESAERLLRKGREEAERKGRESANEPDPSMREFSRPAAFGYRRLVLEGRLLLARGDAEGAFQKLREAETQGVRSGRIMALRDPEGKDLGNLPSGSEYEDWLNLSMAEAFGRLGRRPEALERLGRVRSFGVFDDQLAVHLEKVRDSLSLSPPEMTEFRGDPVNAPDFTLEDLEGKKTSLSDYRGKVVLIMFWATT